jgi:uncharacterized protein involved in copper resistance
MNIFKMSLPVLAFSMAAVAASAATLATPDDMAARQSMNGGPMNGQSMGGMQMTDTAMPGMKSPADKAYGTVQNGQAQNGKTAAGQNFVTTRPVEAKDTSALLTPETQWFKDR